MKNGIKLLTLKAILLLELLCFTETLYFIPINNLWGAKAMALEILLFLTLYTSYHIYWMCFEFKIYVERLENIYLRINSKSRLSKKRQKHLNKVVLEKINDKHYIISDFGYAFHICKNEAFKELCKILKEKIVEEKVVIRIKELNLNLLEGENKLLLKNTLKEIFSEIIWEKLTYLHFYEKFHPTVSYLLVEEIRKRIRENKDSEMEKLFDYYTNPPLLENPLNRVDMVKRLILKGLGEYKKLNQIEDLEVDALPEGTVKDIVLDSMSY